MNQNQGSYIGFFLVSCMIGVICAENQVTLSIETAGFPSVYKDESITVTCTARLENNITSIFILDGSRRKAGCVYDAINKTWHTSNGLNIRKPGIAPINSTSCNKTARQFTLSVSGTVTPNLHNTTFACQANTTTPMARFNSTPARIEHVYVKPKNLNMTVPGRIIEGEAFSFSCSSEEAEPPSDFKYEVLRGDQEVASSSSYTPTEQDRGGIVLRCEDKAHAVLSDVYQHDVIVEKSVKVLYIDFEDGRSDERLVNLNPLYDQALTCGVISNNLAVNWDCNHICMPQEGQKTYLSAHTANNGDQHTMSCTGTVPGTSLPSLTEIWTIEWSRAAPKPEPVREENLEHGEVIDTIAGGNVLTAGAIRGAGFLLREQTGRDELQSEEARAVEMNDPQRTMEA